MMRPQERHVKPLMLIVAFCLAMVANADAGAGAEQAPAGHAATSPASNSGTLPEVMVTAHRIELEKRVSRFVNQIAALENQEGLPRWRRRICPQVTGLPREEGEFVLGRISEIARAAGAPLGDENCGPNLFIVVTTDPKRILEGMNMTTRLLTFAGAHPSVIDTFIKTPRPVRVWYRTGMATPDGAPLGDTDRTDVNENVFGIPHVAAETAYARRNVVWNFTRLLVVVDQTQLRGVSRGQFGDYIAMVSLADLKPGAHLGDAPTILKLFDSAPEAALPGMSEWDQAFLKSLYSTEQTSKGQRDQMAHTIVREIAP
jgi:hypothetical protein